MKKIQDNDSMLMAHIIEDGKYFKFQVFHGCLDVDNNFYYTSKDNNQYELEEFKEGEALVKMEGSFCWRGVWDGRLYFPDEEYRGGDIENLSRFYNDEIVPYCKEQIMKNDPHNYYDK